MASRDAAVDVSIVVPVYNEAESLRTLHAEIAAAMAPLGRAWELICVDDGSSDHSFHILEELARADSRVVAIQFRRNFGQTAAIAAGIDHARGRIVVPLDADLQHDPADIPRLLDKLDEGYDVVSGWRKDRADPFLTRRVPSILANRTISAVLGLRLHDYGCTLKAYRREILDHVHLYGEMHRLIPGFAASIGARITEVPIHHRPRRFGRSKYGLVRTLKVLLDLLTVRFLSGYLTKPIYVFGGAGFALAATGLLVTVVVAVQKLAYGVWVHQNPLAWIAGFCFVSALQLILMGLLAELIVRTYHESQAKPIYVVRRVAGHSVAADRLRPQAPSLTTTRP
jgi:glycosyltransferase involved in cell wall biosynthesis